MQNVIKASALLVILFALNTQAFAGINCKFISKPVSGIKSIQLTDESVVINGKLEIALEKTSIKCGSMGRRDRFEGTENGYQIILKDCSGDDSLEGHLIDSVKQEVADISCN
ncbi:MAG TPA: hypothetical protein VNJ08_00870 [Bacteriovoracaceae bacterium]|nr:hypothetical protein [Bacteriovoracaceae bacterium]